MHMIIRLITGLSCLIFSIHPAYGQEQEFLRDEPITPIQANPAPLSATEALGKLLFHDPLLSLDQTHACITCHQMTQGGAEPRPVSTGHRGKLTAYNSSSTLNLKYNYYFQWTGAKKDLDDAIEAAFNNAMGMATDWPLLMQRLSDHETYADMFEKLYKRPVDKAALIDALNSYLHRLNTPGSRFDQWLMGDDTALNNQELDGYRLFKSIGCISCHNGSNIGGTLIQNFGIYNVPAPENEADQGRYLITGYDSDKQVFRVPGLRNIAETAPYFHRGQTATLEQAVQIMAQLQLDRNLTDNETDTIVAFLKTLSAPVQEFSDP